MKDKFLALSMVSVFLGMASCSDKEPDAVIPVEPGTEIQFGSTLDPTSDIISRTYYGDPTGMGTFTVWPIYWNPASNPDHIFIYSPEATQGRNQASYTVVRNDQNLNEAAQIKKDGAFGVQAGDATNYNFYGLYPASAVTAPATGTTINGTLPGAQTAVFTGTSSDKLAAEAVAPTPTGGNVNYYMKPDMSACLMTAQENNITLTENTSVNMVFKPFATCVDITINGPETNTTTDNTVRVTQVILKSNAAISGDFSYDFAGEGSLTIGENASNTISISTMAQDAQQDLVGIPLQSGNTLQLQAFILPNKAITDLSVQIVTSDFKVYTKNLTVTNLGKGQINSVKLPRLNGEEGKLDYSVWLSQLDPRIYISEISLPGSCLSFNTSAISGLSTDQITQSGDIVKQFDAGVRVFQAHCWPVNENGADRLHLVVPTSTSAYDTGEKLVDVLQELKSQMVENHGNEFCVLMLSDYELPSTSYTLADFYRLYDVLSNQFEQEGLLANNVGSSTTLADVKGKIILKLALNGTLDTSGSGLTALSHITRINNTLAKFQAMETVSGSMSLFNIFNSAATTTLTYSPLVFKSLGSFTYTEASGLTWSSYQAPALTGGTPGLIYDMAREYITSSTSGAGSVSFTTKPTNFDSDFWYVYIEEANPSASGLQTSISSVVNSIVADYDTDTHNKIFMTYCGGNGGSEITTAGLTQWEKSYETLGNRPAGWVLFNDVNGAETQKSIAHVIGQNTLEGFKLNRNRTSTSSKAAPTGDTAGTKPGGSLFGN